MKKKSTKRPEYENSPEALEEISFSNNWINKVQIKSAIKFYGNCQYSKYLKKLS